MTTAVTRPLTVTARIDTVDAAPVDTAPAPAVYTATVYINTVSHGLYSYQRHHPLAEATRPDNTPLRLIFHASDRIHDHEAAARAAYTVGNHQGPDDNGQTWPSHIRRSVSTGDVIKITCPDHWIIHLSVTPTGFSAVPEPTTLVPLTTTRAPHPH